jgi:hypothetical protein
MSRLTSSLVGGEARAATAGGGPSLVLDLLELSVKKETTFERGRRSEFFIDAKKQKKSVFSCRKVASSM